MTALEQLTEELSLMADWRDQVRGETQRAEILFRLGLLTQAHLDNLKRRVALWREAAKSLGESIPGSLGHADPHDRKEAA